MGEVGLLWIKKFNDIYSILKRIETDVHTKYLWLHYVLFEIPFPEEFLGIA